MIELAIADRGPDTAFARAGGEDVEIQHPVERPGAQIGSVEQNGFGIGIAGDLFRNGTHRRLNRRGQLPGQKCLDIHGMMNRKAVASRTVNVPAGKVSPSSTKLVSISSFRLRASTR